MNASSHQFGNVTAFIANGVARRSARGTRPIPRVRQYRYSIAGNSFGSYDEFNSRDPLRPKGPSTVVPEVATAGLGEVASGARGRQDVDVGDGPASHLA
jgi:hypothetical protein